MLEDRRPGKRNWYRRVETEKIQARQRGEEISDEEARKRAIAKLHRPILKRLYLPNRYVGGAYDPCFYDGVEVELSQGRVALPNCALAEPKAVHARRSDDKITREVARMIEEGGAQPEELRFICSDFFVYARNNEVFLVRFGGRRIPYRIEKTKLIVCYVDSTVTLHGYRPIRVESVGVFEYYFRLYSGLC